MIMSYDEGDNSLASFTEIWSDIKDLLFLYNIVFYCASIRKTAFD